MRHLWLLDPSGVALSHLWAGLLPWPSGATLSSWACWIDRREISLRKVVVTLGELGDFLSDGS